VTSLRASARRRRLLRAVRQAAGFGLVATLVAVLGQSTTAASFTAATGDTGNVVSAAASFCSAPGTSGVTTANQDAGVNQANQAQLYNGTQMAVGTSSGGDSYMYIRFNMPTVSPAGCTATSATLSMTAPTSQAATIDVVRAAGPWSETSLYWPNQPGYTGTAVSKAVTGTGVHTWSVAAHVNAMLTGPNYGFVVKDQLNSGGPTGTVTRFQIYNGFTAASGKPTLTITWG
jgi:hypothetical protein